MYTVTLLSDVILTKDLCIFVNIVFVCRSSENEEKLSLRLKIAEREMKYKERIELFDKIIVSSSLDNAYNELKNFLKKESDLLTPLNNTEENRLLSLDDDQLDPSGKKFIDILCCTLPSLSIF